jgi:uncharacterized membrane protein YoaK (UPF0700 family)
MADQAAPDVETPAIDRGHLFPLCLALTAGFADAFGFLRLHGLLTAHVTGNLAFMAVGIAQGSPRIIMKFLALPLFMLGVGLATVFITKVSRHRGLALAWSLLLEAALLGFCILAGRWLPSCRSADDVTGFTVGTILIMAMATQNTIMRVPLQRLPSTTAMTTNVTETAVQWTHWLIGFGRKLSPEDRLALFARARTVALTVTAFAVGGVAGGISAVRIGYAGLLAPICLLALLAARAFTLHRANEAATAYPRPAHDHIQGIPPKAANSRE